ncbi:MAG: succinate--CoA ligase subunit alpha [Candidatus Schekmanbacteria bacterium]|nr:succinate--CoA ligase subunit alpha [Candidatus Schekmanbacteria bacterium]
MAILADENTKIIIQGITGREATTFTKDLLDYGANVVGGITPGKGGWEVYGVPVYDTVKQCIEKTPANACVISVPPGMVKGAAFEAIDNGIKLVVIVTERVPRKDVIDIVSFARLKDARVIGPNSLGLISPHKAKVGMVGGRAADVRKAYSEGSVGIISRSGGMTTEIANLLTLNGIGQSTCISIGGDAIVGSNYLDLIPLFAKDKGTKAVVIFCEPGGNVEESLSELVIREKIKLPIVAFVAGRFADEMPGVRFGHAAAIVEGNKGTTKGKIEKFRQAGIMVAEEFKDIIKHLKSVM